MRNGIYLIYELRCGTRVSVSEGPQINYYYPEIESALSFGFWFICFSTVLLCKQYRKFSNHMFVVLLLRLFGCVFVCVCGVCVCVCVLVSGGTITLIVIVKNIYLCSHATAKMPHFAVLGTFSQLRNTFNCPKTPNQLPIPIP